ncbi:MAG: adenylosuccinate lyase [Candidatus Saccharimonadales bacterium]
MAAESELFGKSEYGALSTVDGRDASMVTALRPHLSEFGLMKNRTRVEAAWMLFLSVKLPEIPILPDQARELLEKLSTGEAFGAAEMGDIKTHEAVVNHDVKSVELMLRDRFADNGSFGDHIEFTHFGLTSEDVNNLAEGIGLGDAREQVLLPAIGGVVNDLGEKALAWADIPMLGRTHGQPATPTTLGKEIVVFKDRIEEATEHFAAVAAKGKLNGATGGYNALAYVYPDVNWAQLSKEFVESLGLEFNRATTQVEPHDWMARYLHGLSGALYPMTDLTKDMWLYISQDYIKQIPVEGEVGSSTMPQKINPIMFEKAESNFETFYNGADGLARKLTQSRLQRDLSDSSSRRAMYPAIGHALIGITSLKRGLAKVDVNEPVISADLDQHWEVLTENIQQVMRRYNAVGGYDKMKEISRGKKFTKDVYLEVVDAIAAELPGEEVERLRAQTPATNVGYAAKIARGTELDD